MFMWPMCISLLHFVLEFAAGTNYAYVKVLTGDKESYKGYVNSEYITKLGEPTVRIGTEE